MRAGVRPLLVLHSVPRLRDELRRIDPHTYSYHEVGSWSELAEEIAAVPPSALVVVDPYHPDTAGEGLAPELRSVLVDFPSIPVFAVMEVRPGRRDDLRMLGTWGVAEVIALGHDDTPAALRLRFREAAGRPLKTLLAGALPRDLSMRARTLVEAAAEAVTIAGDAREMARRVGVSRRTLLRWSKDAELPPPRRLLAWMRILLAAELLDDPGRSVRHVAEACGYSSDSGLRRVMQAFVGTNPTALRRKGAFARASRIFLEQMARARGTRNE
ncbi:MAG TPA: helix-turn-helix domain-containing protein [Longimicrobium sp.]|jgi:AraC-like DNA-binding protein